MTRNQFSSETLLERYGPDMSFKQVMEDLEADAEMLGEVICGIEINGRKVEEADEVKFHDLTVAEIKSLSIATGRPYHLAQGIIENWIQTLPRLIESAEQISQEVRFEGTEKVGQPLADLFDASQYFVDSLVLLKGQFVRSKDFGSVSEVWDKAEALLSQTISGIFQAVEEKDYQTVADLLEFDLCQRLQEWQEVIAQIDQIYFQKVELPSIEK